MSPELNCICPCEGCLFFSVCFEPCMTSVGSTIFVPIELNFCSKVLTDIAPSQSYRDTFIINPKL